MKPPKSWIVIRRKTGLIEWVCPHAVGHPAPLDSQPASIQKKWPVFNRLHECDGCCSKEKIHEKKKQKKQIKPIKFVPRVFRKLNQITESKNYETG